MFTRVVATLLLVLSTAAINAQHPLEPVDTSSPRATMESFIVLTDEASRRYSEYRNSPNLTTQKALEQAMAKGKRLLDLSQVPPATRLEVAADSFVLLWEVIARLELPALEEIPDAAANDEGEPVTRWRIPHTEIIVAQVVEGERAGEYLFSPDTVKRARVFYEMIRELPYLRPVPTENLSRTHQLITGWMIPMAWTEALPEWTNTPLFGLVLWKWFMLIPLFSLALGVVFAVSRWARRKSRDGSLVSYLRLISTPLSILLLVLFLYSFARDQISVTGAAALGYRYLLEIVFGAALVWAVWLTVHWIAERIVVSPQIGTQSLNASLLRFAARFIGFLAVFWLIFLVAHELGFPLYGLVAGAGVGGLAVALAARNTLENFIGTLNLFADRPVKVGDFCRYGEDPSSGWLRIGTIEEIGLRSTKIRGIDRTITSIPNADFSNMHIVNLTQRDRMLFRTTISLRYETTSDQIRLVLVRLREMLLAHPRIAEDPARVRAIGFSKYSLDLELFAYVMTSDWNDFLAVQEDLVLRIMDIVKQTGAAFAYPSRTLYYTRDAGLDIEKQQDAEKQVREWAAAHSLPFPEFPREHRQKIKDTLYYPPEGSPGADRG